MAILNFPTNPAVNETYTFEGKTWYWTGQGWRLTSFGAINGIPIGNITPASGAFTTLTASLLTAGPATFTGNVIAGNLRTGNLSITGNINGPVAVTGNLEASYISSATGIEAAGPISAAGNVTATYFLGDGSLLTGITATNVSALVNGLSNVRIATANANVTVGVNGVGNVLTIFPDGAALTGSFTAAGNIIGANFSAVGNASADYFLGNGRFLTGINTALAGNLAGNIDTLEYSINSSNGEVRFGNTISVIGNAIVTDDLIVGDQIVTTGNITTTANVHASWFIGNLKGNIQGNFIVPGDTTEVLFNTNGDADASSGFRFVKTSNTVFVGNVVSAAGNIIGANLATSGVVSAAGNVTGDYFIGNGRFLTGIDTTLISNGSSNVRTYANANVTVSANGVANIAEFSDAGLALNGILSASGNITSAANVMAQYFVGNFAGNISGNLTVPGANTEVIFNTQGAADATAGFTFDKVSNTVAVSNVVSAAGNIVGANIVTAGEVSATGNVTGNYFIGNGRFLTGIDTTLISNGDSNVKVYANANVAVTVGNVANVAVFTTDGVEITANASVTGNVSAGNVSTIGNVSATGFTGGNVSVTGNVYATTFVGNISGNIDAGGANTQIQFNDNDILNGSSALTFDKVSNVMSVAGTVESQVVTAAGNVTGGNLLTGGQVSASGNVTGSNVTAVSLVLGSTLSATGNVNSGNLNASGLVAALGNVSGSNLVTGGNVVAVGNVSASYVLTTQIQGNSVAITATGTNQGIDLMPNGTGNVNVNSHYINNLLDPQQAQDAATKAYVDAVAEGLNIHDSVLAATPDTLANISGGTVSYNNGNAGVGANLVTTGSYVNVDGINIATANTRILVKNEANAAWNGIYVYSNATVLIRATDYDTTPEVERGDFVFVGEGTLYGNTSWVQTSNVVTLGTSNITWTQFSGAGTYQAGNGLSLNGVIFNVNVDPETTTINGSNQVAVKASANLITPNIGNATGSSLSLTGNIDLVNLNASGYVSATGNIIGGNVQTAGVISVAGNVDAGNVNTQNISLSGNVISALNVSSNVLAPNLNTTGQVSAQGNAIAANFETGGQVSATGNITGGNISAVSAVLASTLSATGNVTGGNILIAGIVSAQGNVTGDYFIGNGKFLSGIDTTLISNGNSNVKVYANSDVAVSVSGIANVAVFKPDVVEIFANVSATGNVLGDGLFILNDGTFDGNLVTNGSVGYFNVGRWATTDTIIEQGRGVDGAPLVSDNGEDRGQQLWFYDGSEKSAFTGFQRSSGKILLARDVSVSNNVVTVNNYGNVLLGNIEGQSALLNGTISASGNITGANLITLGNVDATGNVAGNYFIGNGRFLTGIDTTLISNGNSNVKVYANANVATTVAGVANVVVVSDSGQFVSGVMSASGNITGSNVYTTGTVAAGDLATDTVSSNTALSIGAAANSNISIDTTGSGLVKITGTNGFVIPVGNTAQRPDSPSYANVDTGTLRYNSTIGDMEVFNGNAWVTVGSTTGTVTIVDQQITPDGSSATYSLTQNATAASIIVTWNGVQQIPNDSYTVTGNAITFYEPPLTTDAIDIRFLTGVSAPSVLYNTTANSSVYVSDAPEIQFTVDNLLRAKITAAGVTDLSAGHSLQLPAYTTANAQALTNVANGQIIYVTDGNAGAPCLAVYSGNCWARISLGACISST